MRSTQALLRRGKPRPPSKMFLDKWRRVPSAARLHQGGQPMFHDFMLRDENEVAANEQMQMETSQATRINDIKLPYEGVLDSDGTRLSDAARAQGLSDAEATLNQWTETRGYNDLEMIHSEHELRRMAEDEEGDGVATDGDAAADTGVHMPDPVRDESYFKAQYGYSLVKDTTLPRVDTAYSQLDMWAEVPKYTRGTYFLYIVSRRRNTYAVIFDFDGKRVHPTFSAGNCGLKGGDKGFKAEGSPEVAHQVTTRYLTEAIPKIREREAEANRAPMNTTAKIDLVVRVLGFYNGRQGGIRAVNDRDDVFNVKTFEDVTPFPLNGPKMPKRKQA